MKNINSFVSHISIEMTIQIITMSYRLWGYGGLGMCSEKMNKDYVEIN